MVEVEVPISMLRGMLCGAFEGGSHYWIECPVEIHDVQGKLYDDLEAFRKKYGNEEDYWPAAQLAAFIPGFELWIPRPEDLGRIALDCPEASGVLPTYLKLNMETMTAGTKLMAAKFSQHFHAMINESDDAETADVWLQCCLLGDVVYG